MANIARGTFEVKLTPIQMEEQPEGSPLMRLTLDKVFQGDLAATSNGEMLSAGTLVEGSAGYVAIERVYGTLDGRKGMFILQHSGTLNRGAASLTVHVVPDSGMEELAGLKGTMMIDVSDGHAYEFEYSFE